MTTYSLRLQIPSAMEDTITTTTAASGFGGLFGPAADLPIQAAIYIASGMTLADQAGHYMTEETMKKIAYGVSLGIVNIFVAAKIGTAVVSWLAAIGTGGLSLLVGAAANGAISAKLANAYTRALALYFIQTDSISDSDLAIEILLALIAVQFGLSSNRSDVIS